MITEDQKVLQELYDAKESFNQGLAYCETMVELEHYLGPKTGQKIPAGTTMKIVMVSRFGDVGLTTDLKAECGYTVRVDPEGHLKNLRMAEGQEKSDDSGHQCPKCGGTMVGDGYTMVSHCENVDVPQGVEADAPAIYCEYPGKEPRV